MPTLAAGVPSLPTTAAPHSAGDPLPAVVAGAERVATSLLSSAPPPRCLETDASPVLATLRPGRGKA